jgi:signal transduction histidine kinase
VFRALERRVTLSFVIAVLALCALLGSLATWAACTIIGTGYIQAQRMAANELPAIAQQEIAAAGSLERARRAIEEHFAGSDVVVRLRPARQRGFGGGPSPRPPPGGAPSPPREFFNPAPYPGVMLVMSISRLHPLRVPVEGDLAFIVPDVQRLNRAALSFFSALGAIVAVVLIVAAIAARLVARAAMRPLIDVTLGLRRLAQGEFARHWIDTNERNPLGELAAAYNGAVDQVTAAIEERLETESEMRAFIADAGHELRTPLTVVTGYIDVLQKGAALNAPLAERIYASMKTESRRMRSLIDKLILLARLERLDTQGAVPIEVAPFITRVIDAVAPLGSGVEFVNHSRDAVVLIDESELHAAIANLIENALKYAPDAPVTVELLADDAHAEIVVSDGGSGMSAAALAHAFDRFYRGDDATTPGSGLGLAIAKRAVERARGTLTLASEPGSGLRATIRLPLAQVRSAEEPG